MWESTSNPGVTASTLGRIPAQADPWGRHKSAQRKLDKCLSKATYKELETERSARG